MKWTPKLILASAVILLFVGTVSALAIMGKINTQEYVAYLGWILTGSVGYIFGRRSANEQGD